MSLTKPYLNQLVTAILGLFFTVSVAAQVEQIGFFDINYATVQSTATFGNDLELISIKKNTWQSILCKVNYTTGNALILDTIDYDSYGTEPLKTASGIFYGRSNYASNGNDQEYSVVHIDTNGIKNATGLIAYNLTTSNSDYPLKLLKVISDQLFFSRYDHATGKHQLLKCNTSMANPTVIYSFTERIINSFVANDSLMVITKGMGDYELYNASVTSGAELRATIPCGQSYGSVVYTGNKNNEYFLSVYHNHGHNALWRTDLTSSGTTRFIDSLSTQSISFENDDFYAWIESYKSVLIKGNYNDPENYTEVPFENKLDFYETQVDLKPAKNVFRLLTHRYGIELARLDNDSIRMIKDVAFGGVSGMFSNTDQSASYYQFPSFTYSDGVDTCYAIMSNGVDSLFYLYATKNGVITSYFPISNQQEISYGRKHNNFFYWFRCSETGVFLERRSLVTGTEPQPEIQPVNSENWTRELIFPPKVLGFWVYDFDKSYNSGSKLLADGSVIMSFTLSDSYYNAILSSEGSFYDSLKGSTVFCKYDRYGNLIWVQSVGDRFALGFPRSYFVTDSYGDIFVTASYSKEAYFDGDTLFTPFSGIFLAKISGANGAIIWKKKLTNTNFINSIEIDGMTIDDHDTLYISLNRSTGQFVVDGQSLSSVNSWNALAKFSPEGNIVFLKKTANQWPNYQGECRSIDYNSETKMISLALSEGYYTWESSCASKSWDYAHQTFDQQGKLIHSKTLVSSDLGGFTSGTPYGKYDLVCGYYRGNMQLDAFSASTVYSGGCHQYEGFIYTYSSAQDRIMSLKVSRDDTPFFPIRAKSNGKDYYIYGTDQSGELIVIRFVNGVEAGYKRLGQKSSPFGWKTDAYFDVNDDYLLVLGNDFKRNSEYGVFPQYGFCQYKTIIKTENAGWNTEILWFEEKEPEAYELTGNDVVAFPNPFSDNITIGFQNTDYANGNYELSDINGKVVAKGVLSGESFQQLAVTGLRSGTYFLRVKNASEVSVVKLLKL